MRRLILPGLALLACGAMLGCSRASDAAQPSRQVLTIHASDFRYELPASFPAGLTTIRLINHGAEPHHSQMIRLAPGHTPEEFFAALAAGGPPPAWISMVGGPNAVLAGDTSVVVQDLEPGTYILLCFIPGADRVPHFVKGMQAVMEVTPATQSALEEPTADVTMTLVDFGFELSGPVKAGNRIIRVENAGPQPHEVVLARMEPGRTVADLLAWEEAGAQGKGPGEWAGGVVALEPGSHAWFSVSLTPGKYILICFVPDAGDGKPHHAHGMSREFEVQ